MINIGILAKIYTKLH